MKRYLTICLLLLTLISCSRLNDPYNYKTESPNYYLKKAQKTNPEKVKTITIIVDTNTVFPNADIMKYINLESIYLLGSIKKFNQSQSFNLDINNLKKFSKLKYLSFSYINFIDFPSELLVLEDLKGLSIGMSNISEIPDDINRLNKLEYLSIRLSNLKSLPNSIAYLDSLKVLDLGNNLFENIPDVFVQLNNIEYINMANPEGNGIYKEYKTPTNKIIFTQDEVKKLQKIIQQNKMKKLSLQVNNCEDKKNLKNLFGDKLGIGCSECGGCN